MPVLYELNNPIRPKATTVDTPIQRSKSVLGLNPDAAGKVRPLHELFIGTRRQLAIIALTVAAVFGLGLAFLSTVSPRYTAVAQLLIDTQRSRSPLDPPSNSVDPSIIASQIETLKSEMIARTVINKLRLDEDPEFTEPGRIARIAAPLSAGTAPRIDSHRIRERRVINRFDRALDVIQAGRSYAAVVRFTSVDPDKAALIANAICDAYIDDQLEERALKSARVNLWVERRLKEYEEQVKQADETLAAFRSENSGELDNSQQKELQRLIVLAKARKQARDTFLNLNQISHALERQTLPTTEARVVTRAEPPITKSWPPTGLTLLFFAMVGCGIGVVAAFASEHFGRTVRTRRHVEVDLRATCLGFLPLLEKHRSRKLKREGGIALFNDEQLPHHDELLIRVRLALEVRSQGPAGTSIGITSICGGEGKTTIALNLAKCIAEGGDSVLLIDADLRNRSLTGALKLNSKHGFPHIFSGAVAVADLGKIPGLGFSVLTQPADWIADRPPDILSSRRMGELLHAAKLSFDYVLLDLPPLIKHVDACAAAKHLDQFLLIAEWGGTKIRDLETIWTNFGQVGERAVGIIINKAPRGSERG